MAEMCDNCSEITSVLESFIERIELDKATQEYENEYEFDSNDYRFIKRHLILTKREADMLFNCIQSWYQRQCICLYSDVDAYDRLVETIFCLIRLLIKQLCIYNHQAHIIHAEQSVSESFIVEKIPGWYPDSPDEDYTMSEDHWTYNEIERLFHLVSKVVTMNFVLYVPIKLIQAKNMELLRTFKSVYSDFKETEIPLGLLRNVDLFCKSEGFQHLKNLFTYSNLPLSIANSAVTLACNLKVWLNVKHVTDLFLPFRSAVLKYMCNITEKDPKSKYMTEFMWNMIKDPLETPIIFDKDGLEFAYKFFTSTTLTVRLSGITQINSYVATFNASTCSEEEANQHASNFAAWFLEKDILSYIFGPNLHVEIIKLSQPVLQFLAIESKITTDDIDIMWQAAQLKHCSKQVFDVLAPLVKNLEPSLIIHLYRLLYKLEPKEHSEQSLHLATCILKHMWLSSATHNLHLPEHLKLIKWDTSNIASLAAAAICRTSSPCKRIKSANSVSNKKKKTDIVSADCEKAYANFEKVLNEKKSDTQINNESDRCFDSDNGRVVVESLKRAKSSSNEDIKDGHEDKKQKSELVNENSEQSKCLAIPADSTDSRIDISDDEEIDVDDNGEHEALHHLANDDEEDDENELTESDEENHAACLQSALKTVVHDQQVPNILISDVTEDTLSGDDGSVSSRMSTKSEKNMADFDGEDAVCDDEIVQLGSHPQLVQNNLIAQRIAHMTFHSQFNNNDHGGHEHNNLLHCQNKQKMKSVRLMQEQKLQSRDTTPFLRYYNLDTIYKPGSTLVWDIVQNPKIALLAENTAYEAEKCLATLICYNADKNVRMRFIEACLHNIHTNRSVPVSLRLLPKIFASFHQVDNSGGMDVKQVTLWAFHSLKMIPIFFSNLNHYIKNELSTDFHTHLINIQARLSFLTYVYSHVGLPDSVRLTSTDLDNLWKCLVSNDIRISDEFFTWLLRQVKGKEQHAFTADTLKHLYCKLVPSLPPQNMTLISLALLQQLCNMCRCRDSILKICGDKIAMNHIWKVALRAINTDVSMSAIQNINMYYINRQLQHEPEFVRHCMRYIAEAAKDIKTNEESSLSCIQRALLLLKTHLDMFRRRYAYHIRRYALQGKRVSSHVVTLDTYVHPINLYIHPAGCIERMALEIYSNEYISELRAEVVSWWYKSATDTSAQCSGTPQESHVRIITQGQEIFHDFDDKTVAELGLKDQQILYISLGTVRQKKKNDTTEIPSLLPPPNVENLPINLLLLPQNFNALFDTMHMLSTFEGTSAQAHMKAQILSRRVWDILIMLPTKPKLLQGFEELRWREKEHIDLNILLDPTSPQKLIYSLYIVEYLSRNGDFTNKPNEELNKIDELPETVEWCEAFIQKGGLEHLFNIFISGKLQGGSEWQQDCLAHLLKLLCLLGTYSKELCLQNSDKKSDKSREKDKRSLNETYNLVRRKSYLRQQHSEFQKRQYRQYEHQHERKTDDHSEDDIPRLNTVMEHLMTANDVMPRFTSILMEMATPKELAYYKTGFWGKGQVIHYAMKLLICWSKTCSDVCRMLFSTKNFSQWLCKLVLEDHDPIVRRETSAAVYKLCATSKNGFLNLYNDLVKYIDKAERMKPHDHDTLHHPLEEGKEPYGPTCRDYFWLLSRLVDNLPEEVTDESSSSTVLEVNLNELANKVWNKIDNREYIEKRHNPLEDDGLIGMLNLLTIILKYEQRFKFSDVGADALNKTFQFLFEVPDAEKRHVPKCKSPAAKVAAYDLLLELAKNCSDNFKRLYSKLLQQHLPGPNSPYPWEYWPHDDERAECGFVGLTNLGATCYMASCMQHLYMMPEARYSILNSQTDENTKHRDILLEIQKMFAYMLESERKTYNPRSFCKVYTMDHQPLNTGEQKDMAEFFIDLVSKLEEMTPDLKELVKSLFGGIISNNVVSLDCDHVSRTREEFYTVRCQVADMKSLIESLNEVTVKDTLEGDNMYTCSQCGRKVRAEKRACFRRLPKILCFNTMRYTFNMITMLKEKVNTHFSFPMRLDMSYYLEKYLMPQQFQEEKEKALEECKEAGKPIPNEFAEEETYEYELIGVTVHTGNADGGHYYSFIRDPSHSARRDKWYYFNDAEVKPFDANQIPTECFGGEITSKTYDSITDKFLDLCFEKTNSAYMLFYERIKFDNQKSHKGSVEGGSKDQPDAEEDSLSLSATTESPITLKPELKNWIWRDNTQFLQEKNIFEHSYFEFMFQLCSHIPQTLDDVTENSDMACQLCTTFFLETLMHSKEKPTMVQWVELLTKQFQASQNACEWFLHRMTIDNWWPIQNLFKCPNQMVRQVYQRLCIHVMQCLRGNHASFLKKNSSSSSSGNDSNDSFESPEKIECSSCVTSFIRALVNLFIAHGKINWKHLAEFFTLFSEFNKLGSEETQFILNIHAIYSMVNFYLTNKPVDTMDIITEEEEEEDTILPLTEKGRPASLEKMISFICGVLEKAKKLDLDIPAIDYNILTGKSFAFITQQIKDNVSLHYTRNLIQILTKWNEAVAVQLVSVLVSTIQKHCNNLEACQPFYKLLSGLIDAPPQPGLPNYMEIILLRVWEIADFMPYSVLEWLSLQVTKNQSIASWVIQGMNLWAEKFLLCSMNQRVRSVSAHLIANLVPNNTFRQTYRTSRALCPPPKDIIFTTYEREILHKVYINLLKLLKTARLYVDTAIHHCANKLICYFSILNYYTLSRQEKLLCGPFVTDLWHVYYPQLAELTIPVNQNKQVVLIFMHNILTDCPENVKRLLQINSVVNNIAYNYILTDNDDQEVIMYNRLILPAFYGILRMMCEQSVSFTKQLSKNKNVIWGIKHLALNPTVYANAIEELFKLLKMFITIRPEHAEEDIHRIKVLQRQILLVYLRGLDPHSGWATFIPAVKTLVDGDEARHYFVLNNGFVMMLSTFTLLHNMYHEATACHVYTDLLDVVNIISESVKYIRTIINDPEVQKKMNSFKEWPDIIRKMTTLLNTYNCNQMRSSALSTLTELIYIRLSDVVESVVPMLLEYHTQYHENDGDTVPLGPYFPRSTHKPPSTINKNSARPPRPLIQMSVSQHQIDSQHGVNPEYDTLLHNYYFPYHLFIDLLCEEAAKHGSMSEQLVMLYTAVGLEGAPLRFTLFPKFCLRVFEEKILNKEHISVLVKSIYLHEYVEHVLFEDRAILTSDYVYEAFKILVTKIGRVIINDRNCKIMETTVLSFDSKMKPSDEDLADTIDTLRALDLFYSCAFLPPPHLEHKLKLLLEKLSVIEKSRKPTVHRGSSAGRRLDHFGRSAESGLEKLMDDDMPNALDREKSRNVGMLTNSVVIIDDESGGTEEVVDDELDEEEEECIEDGEIEISDDDDEDEQLDEEDISEDVDDELENNEELEEEEEDDTVASENQSQESDADSKTESTNASQERVYNGSAERSIDALIDIIEHRANDNKNAEEFRDSS